MARKRTALAADNPAAQIVQSVADSTQMPDISFDTATLEKQAENGHAERVKRQPGYTNQGTSDYAAGVRIHEYQDAEKRQYLSIVKFDEKPSREITKMLRENGFDFNRDKEEWYRPIGYETRQQDRISADRVVKEAAKMIREEKGLEPSLVMG